MKNKNKALGVRKSLLFKIVGIFSTLLIVTISLLSIMNMNSIRTSSLQTAKLMGNSKLRGDMVSFEDKLAQKYGHISLKNGNLIDAQGGLIKNDYSIVDLIASRLGIHATIFIKENNDYRRISTSIIDGNGKRAVDTFLGADSAAYKPIQSGNDYFGEAKILGNTYITAYRPFFAANSSEVIGILFIGI